jgi:hypothetical protein
VELKPPEYPAGLARREGGVEGSRGVSGEIIDRQADALGLREVDIDEFAHAQGAAQPDQLRAMPIKSIAYTNDGWPGAGVDQG